MKKILLLSLFLAFAGFAFGQTIYEGFDTEIPSTWTIIDEGANPGTWEWTEQYGLNDEGGATIDTWDGDNTAADDWLISPQFQYQEGDWLSFWATCSGSYPDSISVRISTSGTTAEDFTIEVDKMQLTGSYEKYSYDLANVSGISAGDNIHVGFYVWTNGSYVNLDDFKVAAYTFPNMSAAYNLSTTSLNVLYDGEVIADPIQIEDYKIVSGEDTITFDSYSIDTENSSLVKLTSASDDMIGDNVLDTLYFEDEQHIFYAGFMPVEYTSLTNPDGTMEEGYNATFKGIVTEKNSYDDQFWIADGPGAHHSVNTSGTEFSSSIGDEIMFYGELSPYDNQTEIYKPTFIKTVSTDNDLYGPVTVSAADIDVDIAADSDPAEKYEGTLIKVKNISIYEWDGQYYFYGESSNDDTVRIGDRFNTFDEGFDSDVLNVDESYTITGIFVGRGGKWQINPRNAHDIIPLDDATAPQISCSAQTVSNSTGATVEATSNEIGMIYVILDGEAHSTLAELDAAVDAMKGAKAKADSNATTTIPVNDIQEGTYYAYAVDRNGNISDPSSNAITIESASYDVPYVENFEDSENMPEGIVLSNRDNGTPATSLPEYQDLKEDAFIVLHTDSLSTEDFGSDNARIVVGTSWYDEEVGADDWLILPKVRLTADNNLSWDALSLTSSGNYPDDYEVYVSTTYQTVEACMQNDPIFSITGENTSTDADSPGDGLAQRTVDLAEKGYADQDVYIAFRLMTPYPGGDRLGLDNIRIYVPDETPPEVTADAQTVTIGDDVHVQSSEPTGKVYIILDGEAQESPSDLESAVTAGTAASAEVTAADTDIAISTTDLSAGTYYAYAVDSAGNMSTKSSNAITLEEGGETGVNELNDANINIYPNPVNNSLKFTSEIEITKVIIFNALGQKLKEVKILNTDKAVNTSDLKEGMYFINFENEKGLVKTSKFIKR